MKFKWTDLLVLLLLAVPFVYLYFAYSTLPEQVPIHWGLDGRPNDWSEKNRVWLTMLFMSLIALGNYLLFRFMSKIDPKKKVGLSQSIFDKIALVVVVFIVLLNMMMLYSANTAAIEIDRLVPVLVALVLAFIGNLMNNLKPNYFLGIRTPWTLEDESIWIKTHRLASKIWFAGGLLAALLVALLSQPLGTTIFVGMVIIMALVPVVYSFILFKQSKK